MLPQLCADVGMCPGMVPGAWLFDMVTNMQHKRKRVCFSAPSYEGSVVLEVRPELWQAYDGKTIRWFSNFGDAITWLASKDSVAATAFCGVHAGTVH